MYCHQSYPLPTSLLNFSPLITHPHNWAYQTCYSNHQEHTLHLDVCYTSLCHHAAFYPALSACWCLMLCVGLPGPGNQNPVWPQAGRSRAAVQQEQQPLKSLHDDLLLVQPLIHAATYHWTTWERRQREREKRGERKRNYFFIIMFIHFCNSVAIVYIV